jgi:hypothetical protein
MRELMPIRESLVNTPSNTLRLCAAAPHHAGQVVRPSDGSNLDAGVERERTIVPKRASSPIDESPDKIFLSGETPENKEIIAKKKGGGQRKFSN